MWLTFGKHFSNISLPESPGIYELEESEITIQTPINKRITVLNPIK